jgi:hypothetical protein
MRLLSPPPVTIIHYYCNLRAASDCALYLVGTNKSVMGLKVATSGRTRHRWFIIEISTPSFWPKVLIFNLLPRASLQPPFSVHVRHLAFQNSDISALIEFTELVPDI